jgi:hypothetical protein
MFTKQFDEYLCDGDSIKCEVNGFTCIATAQRDECPTAPWAYGDGHGPVSDWVARPKKSGELVLGGDRHSKRFYDFAEACRIARADGWGCEGGRKDGETARAYAARAALEDYEVLRAWCDDEWAYYGVLVRVWRAGVPLTGRYAHALWGLEGNYPGSDNGEFLGAANELLQGALDAAVKKIAELQE